MRIGSPGLLSIGAFLCRKAFGLRWRSVAATPLVGGATAFQSGVALRFPPQSRMRWLWLYRAVFTAFIVMGVAMILSCRAVAGDEDWKLPAEKTVLKEGAGRELILGQCLLCHSSDYIATQPRLTRAQWQTAVEKMRAKYGAPIQTNNVPAILDYLTAAYGKPVAAK